MFRLIAGSFPRGVRGWDTTPARPTPSSRTRPHQAGHRGSAARSGAYWTCPSASAARQGPDPTAYCISSIRTACSSVAALVTTRSPDRTLTLTQLAPGTHRRHRAAAAWRRSEPLLPELGCQALSSSARANPSRSTWREATRNALPSVLDYVASVPATGALVSERSRFVGRNVTQPSPGDPRPPFPTSRRSVTARTRPAG